MSGRYDNVCTLEKLRIYFPNSPWWNTTADTRDLETTKKVLRDACLVNKNDDRRLRQLCPDQVGDINEKVDKLLRDTQFIRNTFDKLNEGIPNITKEIKLRKFIDWYRETGQKYSPNIWFSSCNLTFRPLWENREWKTSNQSIQDSLKSIGGQDLETVLLKDISHPACKETFLKVIFVDIDPLNGQKPKLKQALESGPAAMAVQLPAKTFDQVIKEINQELEERNTSNAALEKQKMLRKCVDRWRKRGWLPGGTEMFLTGEEKKILKRRGLDKLEETKHRRERKSACFQFPATKCPGLLSPSLLSPSPLSLLSPSLSSPPPSSLTHSPSQSQSVAVLP
ncbi:uncharacterized protein [Narcine bancroftii]|uniref:uncharacterized protein n=1 Tax=Narcine bancroftii TaxID=1343680 RepID=UPI0038314A59